MAEKVKRSKTKYPNIYLNEHTGKYDVKYNYKEYDPFMQKNKYKSKWVYSCLTLTEAKAELAKLQTGINRTDNEDITLQGAFELWKIKASAQRYSNTTVFNTEQQLKTICKYLPADTKLKNITEDVYYQLFDCLRKEYSEETIYTLNSAFRKLVRLAYKRGFIADNFLHKADNIKTKKKDSFRLLTHEEFEKINHYLGNSKSNYRNYNSYPRLQFFYNILYYTGVRLGECLALTWSDFQTFDYYSPNTYAAEYSKESVGAGNGHFQGKRLHVTKARLRSGDIKEPKNLKHRTIPLPSQLEAIYDREYQKHIESGGSDNDAIFTYTHSYCLSRIKQTCKKIKIEPCNCHSFRHTYISNLIKQNVPISVIEKVSGDTQQTIFARYSHMFENDEVMVLKALENL